MNESLPYPVSVALSGLNFPEGPAFDSKGRVWLVELKGGNLVKLERGVMTRYPTGGNPNGIAIDARDRVWFCDAGQNSIRVFDPEADHIHTVVAHLDGIPLNKPNDLAFDAAGNLVFTCPGESRQEPSGYVCVWTNDHQLKVVARELYFPNGLAFTSTGRELVIAETYRHRLWKGAWDVASAKWTNAGVWSAVGGPEGPGGPDGMAFDSEGFLYVAVYGTGTIRIVDGAGKVVRMIALRGKNPTNCAFARADPSTLVVTEAEHGHLLRIDVQQDGGKIFYPEREYDKTTAL